MFANVCCCVVSSYLFVLNGLVVWWMAECLFESCDSIPNGIAYILPFDTDAVYNVGYLNSAVDCFLDSHVCICLCWFYFSLYPVCPVGMNSPCNIDFLKGFKLPFFEQWCSMWNIRTSPECCKQHEQFVKGFGFVSSVAPFRYTNVPLFIGITIGW